MVLNVNDLKEKQKKRIYNNRELYKEILEICEKKIIYRNSIGGDKAKFKIPYLIVGKPIYNVTHAMMYVIRKLKKQGFTIESVHENEIEVYWGK